MTMKPRLAVHKFTSCDGCQLAFLNAGEALLTLSELVEMVHFAEAGSIDLEAQVDIAFVEGSISTPDEEVRIKKIRQNSKYLITIGSCATAGGIQALRNVADSKEWVADVYATPDYIKSLNTSTAIAHHVKVDWELWGCPVNGNQVLEAIRFLLSNATPRIKRDSECMECKRKGNVCVLVTKKDPCMGPVTQTGCGSLCPSVGRGCYACYGPKQNPNTQSLGHWFKQLGLSPEAIAQKFLHINNQAPAFNKAGNYFKGIKISNE
ncbi:sulfhydrogenase subunit delta [Legionella sp. EUR-108]|uniref:Sulfhydrogenase subunit delta n=2 Tax=Legionella maioricensis TaxID=2896528 RepID=A0A9X2D1T1_9GAMM|nr:sulfhydrogenase subunit delta [Legionella maioricensis]MCL9684939.1 sulfhydrogenase subunit delta [Legionella maioricensis]MCL9688229.1 sulfhydrogenase subunit delta [Legionella maioricensis]